MLEQFIANPNLRPATKKHYRAVVSRFHKFTNNRPWKEVTSANIGKWLDQYENPVTKDVYLRTLKVFLRWLYNDDLPKQFDRLTVRAALRHQQRLQEEDLLTPDEVKQLVEGCTRLRDKTLVMMLYGTGARISELLNAQIKDVIDKHGQTAIRVQGKEGEHYYYVSHATIPWLNQYLQNLHGNEANELLFDIPYRTVHGILNRAAKRAGIAKRVYPHLFRHMRNTRLVRKVGKDKAKRIMGYAPSSNIIDKYTHLTEQDTVAAFLEAEGKTIPKPRAPPELPEPETLICPRCKFENVAESRFCAKCTLPLLDLSEQGETVMERLEALEKKFRILNSILGEQVNRNVERVQEQQTRMNRGT